MNLDVIVHKELEAIGEIFMKENSSKMLKISVFQF